jgi:protein-tyrosine phosphatase
MTDTETGVRNRILQTENLYNVRELGGYPAAGGKTVKWGLLFRAGELPELTGNDKRLLEQRNITTIVDFRSDNERRAAPDAVLDTVRRRLELSIDAGNLMDMASTENGAETEMKKLYRALPEEAAPRYRVLFSLLADPGATPLLFHCTAGKDRTGLAAALVLHALGADMRTIFDDYLESARCLAKRFAPVIAREPYMAPYMTVQRSYLETAFVRIEEYGGIDRYIQDELGADVQALRRLYTE